MNRLKTIRGMRWGSYQVITRPQALLAVAALILAAVLTTLLVVSIPSAVTQAASSARKSMPIQCTDRSKQMVSLTFDVAQGEETVRDIAEVLTDKKVTATFFITGSWAERHADLVQILKQSGQEIMSASDVDERLTNRSRDEAMQRINAGNDQIQALTGVRPTCLRAPDGEYDQSLLETVKSLKVFPIRWDVDSFDSKGLPADGIVKRVVSQTSSGSIVRFTGHGKDTAEALPLVIDQLKAKGYTFLPVSAMIYTEHYVVNREGRQLSTVG